MENIIDQVAYVHKLNANELGYRGGKPRGAGRFFLIAKSCISYFPPLSEIVLNDHVLLDIIPPFTDEIVLTKYVYHNSQHATAEENEDRDEFRIYLNIESDPEADYYKPDDIVVFVRILSPKSQGDSIYKIFRYTSTDSEYQKLNTLLAESDTRRGTHALIQIEKLNFLNVIDSIKLGKKIIPQEIIEESFSEPVAHAPVTEEDKYDTTRVIRSKSFRDLILYFYEDKCAITGKNLVIEYKDFKNLEAAHILARAAGGGSNPSNGMALERNLHWAFDKGFFTLTEDFKVKVHPDAMQVPYLKEQDGKKIFLPQDSRSYPNRDSMKWHRENVFGIFLKTEV